MPLLSRILKSVPRLDQALSVWICALLFCCALGESAAQPAPLEAKLQLDTATKAAAQGRNDEARSAYENARSLFQAKKNRLGEAYALDGLGDLDRKQGRNDPARKNYLEARGLFQAVGERMGEANVLYALGELDRSLSRHDEARKAYTDALRLYQAAHSRQGQADTLRGLGELDLALGRHDDARKSFIAALSLYRALTNRLSEAHALKGLGHLDRAAGRGDDARKSYEEASRLYRAEQNPLGEANVLLGLGYLDRTLGRYDDARRNFRDAAINYGLAGMGEQQRKANALALSDANSPPESAKQQASLASPVWKVALVALAVIALSGIAAVALRTSTLAPSDSTLVPSEHIETGRRWLHYRSDCNTAVVFVHGIRSSPAGFRFNDSVSWPDILAADPRANAPNIYLAQYYTATDSGIFDIPQASEELRVQLNVVAHDSAAAPLDCHRIVFVAHSTGGIVVRDLLTRHGDLFRGKTIGLVLVASPSRGSVWANRLDMIINLANNRMVGQLQQGNEWIDDLDRRFAELVHKKEDARGFALEGIDLFENRFIAGRIGPLRWLIPTRTVVVSERDSASYFGSGKIVPDTDHFSIAKPSGLEHASHSYLMEWWTRGGW